MTSDLAAVVERLVPATPVPELPADVRTDGDSQAALTEWFEALPQVDPAKRPAEASEWWTIESAATGPGSMLLLKGRLGSGRLVGLIGPGAASRLPAHQVVSHSDPQEFTRWGWRVLTWTGEDVERMSPPGLTRPAGTVFVNFELIAAVVERHTHPTVLEPEQWLEEVVRHRVWHLQRLVFASDASETETRRCERELRHLVARGRHRWGVEWTGLVAQLPRVPPTAVALEQLIARAVGRRHGRWQLEVTHVRMLEAMADGDAATLHRLRAEHGRQLDSFASESPAEEDATSPPAGGRRPVGALD